MPEGASTVTTVRCVKPMPVWGSTMWEYVMPSTTMCCSESPDVDSAAFATMQAVHATLIHARDEPSVRSRRRIADHDVAAKLNKCGGLVQLCGARATPHHTRSPWRCRRDQP